MKIRSCILARSIAALFLLSVIISGRALAQDNTFNAVAAGADAVSAHNDPAAAALPAHNCYVDSQHLHLKVKLADLKTVWRKASRMLFPSAGPDPVQRYSARDVSRPGKDAVWSIGAAHKGVVVSISREW